MKSPSSPNADLEKRVEELARLAGMAEVANGVLHNVANTLNSVNVSASLVTETVRLSKAGNLGKLSALLAEHQQDLALFLSSDPRGKMIQPYLSTLAEELAQERQSMLSDLEHLRKNVEHIKGIIATQQRYARTGGSVEMVPIADLVEDALRMNADSLVRHDIEIAREYLGRPTIAVDKNKVLQILVNLIRNAKYACDERSGPGKRLVLRITVHEFSVAIAVIDNGVGISAETLARMFQHGFTTKPGGHGFGLHSGALAAKEMGGTLEVQSEGLGRGATFTLTLPIGSEVPAHG